MAWTAPITFVPNTPLTAAQLNLLIRDNQNEMAPAKASTPGSIFVTAARNSIVEQVPQYDFVEDTETTTSQEFADLESSGPEVTCLSVQKGVMYNITSQMQNNTAGQYAIVGLAVLKPAAEGENDPTEVIAPTDARSLLFKVAVADQDCQASFTGFVNVPEPGAYIFQMKYRATGGTATFFRRRLSVIPF
jgi:hypothetical protein